MTNETKIRDLIRSGASREDLQSAFATLVATDALKTLREVDLAHRAYIEAVQAAKEAVNELRVAVEPWLWGNDSDELGDLVGELNNACDTFASSYASDMANAEWDTTFLQSAIAEAANQMEADGQVRINTHGHVAIEPAPTPEVTPTVAPEAVNAE